MLKIPRFMKEYANYQKQTISNCELMQTDIKETALTKIDKALNATEKGLITIDAGMKMIVNCFDFLTK